MIIMSGAMMFTIAFLELMVFFNFRPENFDEQRYPVNHKLWLVRKLLYIRLNIMRKAYDLGPWIEQEAWHSIAFSMGLSVVLAAMFPMAGVIAFMGGVASTVLTQPFYMALRFHRKFKMWNAQNPMNTWAKMAYRRIHP